MTTRFFLNGKAAVADAPPQTPLLWVIREGFNLTGTKFGCGTGLCGACMVHIDGKRAYSCQTRLSEVEGKSVTTIEGLSRERLASAAEGLARRARAAVRLLPVRPDHERGRSAQEQTEADARRDRRAHEHQPLPLRNLPTHCPRDRTRIAGGLTMTQHATMERHTLSRRQMMIGVAGLSFAVALDGPLAGAATLAGERAGRALSPWVSIAKDGTITIMSAATEMGQGSMTSLPLIIAEELDADWSKVRIVPAPPVDAIYGNPGFQRHDVHRRFERGDELLSRRCGPSARRCAGCCSTTRRASGASRSRNSPPNRAWWCTPSPAASSAMATSPRFAEIPEKAPEIKPEQLKKPKDFRLIGKDVMRVELPGKVNGSARYGIDVQVPDMIYATVLRAPVEGSVPDKIDDAKAKAIPGVVRIVRLPYGVGVLAESAVGGVRGAAGPDSMR